MSRTAATSSSLAAALGSAGGLGAWLLTHGETVLLVIQIVGGLFGCLLAIVSFLFVLPRFIRFVRRAWRVGLSRADRE